MELHFLKSHFFPGKEFHILCRNLKVVFDSLEEEPSSISSIESGIVATVMKVRNQPMSHYLCKVLNCFLASIVLTSYNEKTSEGDHGISAPASSKSGREVGEASTH